MLEIRTKHKQFCGFEPLVLMLQNNQFSLFLAIGNFCP